MIIFKIFYSCTFIIKVKHESCVHVQKLSQFDKNLSIYEKNKLQPGSALYGFYTLVVLYQKSHSFASLTYSISDPSPTRAHA